LKYDGKTPLTVEAWAALDRPSDQPQPEVLLGNPEQAGFGLSAAGDNKGKLWGFGFFVKNNNRYATARQAQPLPRQHFIHLAGVYDGKSEIRFYVDGLLQSRAPAGAHKASPMPLALGANPNPNSFTEHFLGRIRGVRVSKIACYENTFAPPRRLE